MSGYSIQFSFFDINITHVIINADAVNKLISRSGKAPRIIKTRDIAIKIRDLKKRQNISKKRPNNSKSG